jgi:uncharacterized protein (DUF1684 family)
MKRSLLAYALLFSSFGFGQSYSDTIDEIRIMHMVELMDSTSGVLNLSEINNFQGLSYYDVDTNYRIQARFIKNIGKRFKMITSTDRRPVYRRYGFVEFTTHDTICHLTVYQNMELSGFFHFSARKDYKDYLFIPFRDVTSGKETYGGGRFLDARIPKNDILLIDFNLNYNPYCAYSERYSCPIPPTENTLKVSILAGEKVPVGHDLQH